MSLASLTVVFVLAQLPPGPTSEVPRSSCSRDTLAGLPEGPTSVPYADADFATGRRACLRSEGGLGVQGGLVIDSPKFYGDVAVGGLVFGSYVFRPGWEVFGTLEAPHYELVQNATLRGTALSVGQLAAGTTHTVWSDAHWTLSPSVRVLLPTSSASAYARVVGAELGLAAQRRFHGKVVAYGYAGLDGMFGISAAPANFRGGGLLKLGAEYDLTRGFGLAVDLQAHLGRRAVLDELAPALALRFAVGREFGGELTASAPVAGADRHDAVFALRLAYRFADPSGR